MTCALKNSLIRPRDQSSSVLWELLVPGQTAGPNYKMALASDLWPAHSGNSASCSCRLWETSGARSRPRPCRLFSGTGLGNGYRAFSRRCRDRALHPGFFFACGALTRCPSKRRADHGADRLWAAELSTR